MSDLEKSSSKNHGVSDGGAPIILGIFLALLGGIAAIATGIYVSHVALPLLGIIPVAWMVSKVKTAKKYQWHPTALGGAMGLLALLIAAAALFLHQAGPLYALILVAWFTDDMV